MWNGTFFQRLTFSHHQLTINLCHDLNDCPSISQLSGHKGSLTQIFSDRPMRPMSCGMGIWWDAHRHSEMFGSTAYAGNRSRLIFVSSTGIFKRWIRWCHCAKSSDQYVQLLLCRSSFRKFQKNPKTAFTFEVLDHFRLDALECNTAAMNFMSKIRRITDEAFHHGCGKLSDASDTSSTLIMLRRIVIGSYSEFPDSEEICIMNSSRICP